MKRLLCLLSGMNAGGAETFLMKVYRTLDRSKYQMDFCISVKEKCFYEDEILEMGGRIYRIPSKSENLKEFKRQLGNIVRNEHYNHVLRITSSSMGFMDLKVAKKAGAKVCCARSSNASDGGSLKSKIVHMLGRLYRKYVDVAIAPSDLAAIYTFGKKKYKSGKVHILHNAVDLDIFSFSKTARESVRREFGIGKEQIVVGHIGRFSKQKNHKFLINIFASISEKRHDVTLLLVGMGELENEIKQQAIDCGVIDKIVFAGVRTDIPAVLSAMDVFVMPSFFEGMPNTVIEAQATGLSCVLSDRITKEANISGNVEYLPLGCKDKWVASILKASIQERHKTKQAFIENKYDIESVADRFVKLLNLE